MLYFHPVTQTIRAYGPVVRRHIRIVEAGVRFSLGPPKCIFRRRPLAPQAGLGSFRQVIPGFLKVHLQFSAADFGVRAAGLQKIFHQ